MNTVYHHLEGADRIQAASCAIADAAGRFSQTVENMDASLRRHEEFLQQWLNELREIFNQEAEGR